MKAIKKLRIILPIAMVFIFLPFIVAMFKNNIGWGVALIVLVILLTLFRLLFYKYKKRSLNYKDYHNVHLYYVYGAVFILLAIILSTGIIEDWEHITSLSSLIGMAFILGLWIFGILITYYTYKAKKEFSSRTKITKSHI